MGKKKLVIGDKNIKRQIKNADAKLLRRNFFELLKRAARTISES